MRLSSAAEDCLLLVLRLGERREAASTSGLARALGVTDSTVTAMVQKLARLRLMARPQPREITLTAKGEQLARQLIRRHRLIETYLHEYLGYSWDEVHEEAERLEHAVSERFVEIISEKLGNPITDPHGDPIPDRKGHVANRRLVRLSDASAGTKGRVARVVDRQPDLLVYLSELGLTLGALVQVLTVPAHDNVIHLRLRSGTVTIGREAAREIFLET